MWGSPARSHFAYFHGFLNGANGRNALQRLFSTFPGGRPGVGLLLLRVAVGLTAGAEGIFYLLGPSGAFLARWILGFILAASGSALIIGFMTPFAGFCVGLCLLGIARAWFPGPLYGVQDSRILAVGMVITAAAISLLGPGAFSLDGRLFGRREIVIPPAARRGDD